MFFDPFTLALIGGGIGALTSKKPLNGALIGAGLGAAGGGLLGAGASGATGGAGLIGNMGAASAYGTGLGTEQTAMLAAQDSGMGGGLLGGIDTVTKYAKPVGDAAGAATNVLGLFKPESDRIQASPVVAPGSGPQGLSNLVANNNQMDMMRQREDMERKMRKQQMIARIGGGYGRGA